MLDLPVFISLVTMYSIYNNELIGQMDGHNENIKYIMTLCIET